MASISGPGEKSVTYNLSLRVFDQNEPVPYLLDRKCFDLGHISCPFALYLQIVYRAFFALVAICCPSSRLA